MEHTKFRGRQSRGQPGALCSRVGSLLINLFRRVSRSCTAITFHSITSTQTSAASAFAWRWTSGTISTNLDVHLGNVGLNQFEVRRIAAIQGNAWMSASG